jgi:hypothetical protein
MPVEFTQLKDEPPPFVECPECKAKPFDQMMRGQVQRSRRFLWILWRRTYCCVICRDCKDIVGHESPPKQGR